MSKKQIIIEPDPILRKKSYDLDYSDNNEEVTKQLEALDVENSSKN